MTAVAKTEPTVIPPKLAEICPFAAIVILPPANVGNNAKILEYTLALVKYKLLVDSRTLAVVKSTTFALAFSKPITLANTLAFVKYKLLADSVTLAVKIPDQTLANIPLVITLPAEILPE